MITNKENKLIDKLAERVYKDVAPDQLKKLLVDGKSLMDNKELTSYVKENLNKYLTAGEKNQLILEYISSNKNKEMNVWVLNKAIETVVLYVKKAIEDQLKSTDFISDNPFSPFKNQKMFLLYKFYNEQLGGKLN